MLAVLPHLVLVAGMTSVLFLAWRADHPRIEDDTKPLKSTTQRQAVPDIAKPRLTVRLRSVGKALQTRAYSVETGQGEAVSLLQR